MDVCEAARGGGYLGWTVRASMMTSNKSKEQRLISYAKDAGRNAATRTERAPALRGGCARSEIVASVTRPTRTASRPQGEQSGQVFICAGSTVPVVCRRWSLV